MIKCEICGNLIDGQFSCQYERDEQEGNWLNHNVIRVCDACDQPEWDEDNNQYYLMVDGIRWYN